jgi:hypothetical protein
MGRDRHAPPNHMIPKAADPVKDTDTATVKATPTLPDAQTVTEVQHYTDRLFRFRCTRPASLRFRSGEFVMIGLMGDADPKTGKAKPLSAGLFHRLALLGRGAGILLHQGAERAADLAASAYRGGRSDHPAPQARGHAGA